jgi:hypothetical protein
MEKPPKIISSSGTVDNMEARFWHVHKTWRRYDTWTGKEFFFITRPHRFSQIEGLPLPISDIRSGETRCSYGSLEIRFRVGVGRHRSSRMGQLLQSLGSCRHLFDRLPDELIWTRGNVSGNITAKNSYDAITSKIWNRNKKWWHYSLWKWDLAPKIKLFTWLLLENIDSHLGKFAKKREAWPEILCSLQTRLRNNLTLDVALQFYQTGMEGGDRNA